MRPAARRPAVSPRIAPPVFGVGLLEAIPEPTILAAADPDDADGDGISGRANLVSTDDRDRRARCSAASAGRPNRAERRAAERRRLRGDIGITSSLLPDAGLHRACRPSASSAPDGGEPELDDAQARPGDLLHPHARRAGPARRRTTRHARRAGALRRARLRVCHVAELPHGPVRRRRRSADQLIRPYTDLLLHDMGDRASPTAAARRRRRPAASGAPPPLWGIGLDRDGQRPHPLPPRRPRPRPRGGHPLARRRGRAARERFRDLDAARPRRAHRVPGDRCEPRASCVRRRRRCSLAAPALLGGDDSDGRPTTTTAPAGRTVRRAGGARRRGDRPRLRRRWPRPTTAQAEAIDTLCASPGPAELAAARSAWLRGHGAWAAGTGRSGVGPAMDRPARGRDRLPARAGQGRRAPGRAPTPVDAAGLAEAGAAVQGLAAPSRSGAVRRRVRSRLARPRRCAPLRLPRRRAAAGLADQADGVLGDWTDGYRRRRSSRAWTAIRQSSARRASSTSAIFRASRPTTRACDPREGGRPDERPPTPPTRRRPGPPGAEPGTPSRRDWPARRRRRRRPPARRLVAEVAPDTAERLADEAAAADARRCDALPDSATEAYDGSRGAVAARRPWPASRCCWPPRWRATLGVTIAFSDTDGDSLASRRCAGARSARSWWPWWSGSSGAGPARATRRRPRSRRHRPRARGGDVGRASSRAIARRAGRLRRPRRARSGRGHRARTGRRRSRRPRSVAGSSRCRWTRCSADAAGSTTVGGARARRGGGLAAGRQPPDRERRGARPRSATTGSGSCRSRPTADLPVVPRGQLPGPLPGRRRPPPGRRPARPAGTAARSCLTPEALEQQVRADGRGRRRSLRCGTTSWSSWSRLARTTARRWFDSASANWSCSAVGAGGPMRRVREVRRAPR